MAVDIPIRPGRLKLPVAVDPMPVRRRVGSNNRGEVAGETYGDRKLTALIGGSGGSGASGWWDGGQGRERGAGAGGGGGGAIELWPMETDRS